MMPTLSSAVVSPFTIIAHVGKFCITVFISKPYFLVLRCIFLGLYMIGAWFMSFLLVQPRKPEQRHRSHLPSASDLRRKFASVDIKPLLPSNGHHRQRLCVALDLDETCVWVHPHANEEAAMANLANTCESHLIRMEGDSEVVLEVMMRPDVRQFVQALSSFAEVVVFTASQMPYARAICGLLDPFGQHFSAILARDSTLHAQKSIYVKDLSRLGRDMSRTVIIDDSAYGFILQPDNGFPVAPFRGRHDDTHLLSVVLPAITALHNSKEDVRSVLAKTFQMRSWFIRQGLMTSDDTTADTIVKALAVGP